ncbi:MAG: hypothetical protein JXA15_08560 [Spirochaetales bacterium]|nr:hypothetical protein [Spirochaetales bacterium]
MRRLIAALMLLTAIAGSVGAQALFKEGTPVEPVSPGGLLSAPSYEQGGTAIDPGSLHNFLLYSFPDTRENMLEAERLGTWHLVTAIAGGATFIGGLANFFVAASGVSDLDGTIAMYLTATGLFLGSAGCWYGNFLIFNKRAELRGLSIVIYNDSIGP